MTHWICPAFRQALCLSPFFCAATPPSDIYTLSLHDALPILFGTGLARAVDGVYRKVIEHLTSLREARECAEDRKSTRLNSSHLVISYAVFCLKKKRNLALMCRAPSKMGHMSGGDHRRDQSVC